ncbi:MAG: GNAT family N-acetyltransferase [Candidatus Kerfeldbacteria bacterium]|nr:GNAT family N-acetyltransferase [Candidatus Kerfeldbacteria bacterium]
MATLRLEPLRESMREAYLDIALEMIQHREPNTEWHFDRALNDFTGLLKYYQERARGINLPPGFSPETKLFGVVDGIIIGRVGIRHSLTPTQTETLGHIGYIVRPTWRGKGYGKQLFSLALTHAREFGLDKIHIVSRRDNYPSLRILAQVSATPQSIIRDAHGIERSRFIIDLKRT